MQDSESKHQYLIAEYIKCLDAKSLYHCFPNNLMVVDNGAYKRHLHFPSRKGHLSLYIATTI